MWKKNTYQSLFLVSSLLPESVLPSPPLEPESRYQSPESLCWLPSRWYLVPLSMLLVVGDVKYVAAVVVIYGVLPRPLPSRRYLIPLSTLLLVKERFVPSVEKLPHFSPWRRPHTMWWSLLPLSLSTHMVKDFLFFRPRICFGHLLPRFLIGERTGSFLFTRKFEISVLPSEACACFAVHNFGVHSMVNMKIMLLLFLLS